VQDFSPSQTKGFLSCFAAPAGYVGDEDPGQMGSCFVMMALGLFEMGGGVLDESDL